MFLSWGFEVSSPFYPGIARYPAFNRSRTTRAVRCLCHGSNKRGSFQLFNSWQYSLVHSSLDILWTAEHRSTHPDGTNGLMTRPVDPSSNPFDSKILESALNGSKPYSFAKLSPPIPFLNLLISLVKLTDRNTSWAVVSCHSTDDMRESKESSDQLMGGTGSPGAGHQVHGDYPRSPLQETVQVAT